MNKRLYNYFTHDHRRVEELLEKATANIDNIKEDIYHQFRTGLLTHIKMEEKILFLAAQEANGGKPIPVAAQLRLEHGALTSLMTVPPDGDVVKVIKYVLEKHDEIEEAPGGMYDICESLTKEQTDEILKKLNEVTPVPVHPVNPLPAVVRAAKRSLERAGYDFDSIVSAQAGRSNKDIIA